MSRKKWNVAKVDKEAASRLSAQCNIDPFAALLLTSRNINTKEQVDDFFAQNPIFSDPFELIDMDKAVARIEKALDSGEKIAIYGDYDADGVTSSAILFLYLEMLGANVVSYIPDRNTEGYGMNCEALKKISDMGVSLIITVDNGVSAIKEAEYAASLGMDLVITDHHKVPDVLPKACAVVDAHRKDCPSKFKQWSGVGIAFKLICALSGGDDEDILDMYSDIITIGTIGDVVSLTGENRQIVKHGLKKINSADSCAIDALRHSAAATGKSLSSTAVAFTLVPRINAIGRVDNAKTAFELLICDSFDEAERLSSKIESANAERQRLESVITAEAEKQLAENEQMKYDRVLVLDGENWHGGVIGIVAARFVERYGKPCIIISKNEGSAKGSGRSIEGFSLYDAINSCSYMLTHFGGHTLAAGFSLESKDVPAFRKAVNDYAKTVKMPYPTVELDCKLRPEFIGADIIPIIEKLEPFGADNPQPLFGLFSMTLQQVSPIGGGKHLRLTLSKGQTTITALKFGMTAEKFPYKVGDLLDLAVRLEKNEYMGQTRVSIYIKDIRMSKTDDEKYLESVRLYEKVKRGERLSKEQAQKTLPDRKFVANVYRFVRDNEGWKADTDVLCYRLSDDGDNACKVLISLDALCELGIFKKSGDEIEVANTLIRVNLDDSSLLSYLKAVAES